MTGFDPRLTTIPQSVPQKGTEVKPKSGSKAGPRFESLLDQALKEQSLKFSQHAQKRLQSRGIEIDKKMITELEGALEKARSKSARESLILMQDCAFVVSVPNKTVITVIDGENIKDNVFTNIDSAVII